MKRLVGTGVPVRWVPWELGPTQSASPWATPADTLTCLLPVSPAAFRPFSGLLETLLFTSGDDHSWALLSLPLSPRCDLPFSLPSFPGQARGRGAEKQGAEGRGL